MSETYTFPPRVRFNWGYHDGASSTARAIVVNWSRGRWDYDGRGAMAKYDSYYAAGFELGERDKREGSYCADSTAAWRQYRLL